ncbi:MAG: GNAT family N-acetyltransferase [Clostridium sp.]
MITFERIGIDKISIVEKMINSRDNIKEYRLNFIDFYNSKNKLTQFFYRKNVFLIKASGIYIGYLWTDIPGIDSLKILDLFIDRQYYNLLNESFFLQFKKSRIYYECLETEENTKLFNIIDLKKINFTNLYSLNTNDVIIRKRITDATFRQYILGEDAPKRCDMQNIIFNSDERVLLIPDDILLEEKQSFFINDLCMFIKVNGFEIGYGQIIFNRGVHTIVNFGIIEEYRNRGYGADLLLVLIQLTRVKGIEVVYIRVDSNNKQAISLYESVGFNKLGTFGRWEFKI